MSLTEKLTEEWNLRSFRWLLFFIGGSFQSKFWNSRIPPKTKHRYFFFIIHKKKISFHCFVIYLMVGTSTHNECAATMTWWYWICVMKWQKLYSKWNSPAHEVQSMIERTQSWRQHNWMAYGYNFKWILLFDEKIEKRRRDE